MQQTGLLFCVSRSLLCTRRKAPGVGHRPLDLLRPNPSLSTTSSAHCIRLLLCAEGAVARRRRTGVDVRVCVAVAVVVVVGWLRVEVCCGIVWRVTTVSIGVLELEDLRSRWIWRVWVTELLDRFGARDC